MIAALLACAVLLLCGCAQSDPAGFRMALSANPATLDPRFATDATSARLNRLLYRSLVDFDDHARPVPMLADWQMLDPLHYRFRLLDEHRDFHDGSRLDARDVKATYDSVLDPATASPHRGTLSLIERIEVIDEDTLDFHLHRADPLFPGYLAIGVLPARLLEAGHGFERAAVGSGPFRLHAWSGDDHLVLVRRRDARRFEFLKVPDPTVRVLKLMRGEVDFLQNDLPPELTGYLEGRPGIDVLRGAGTNFSYLGFNMSDPVTGQPQVRRAIAHGVDRERIIRYVLHGGRHANALLPPEHWASNPDLDPLPHDVALARELLRDAGFDAKRPLRLTYKTSSDPFRVRLATIIQSQLRDVGIEVEILSYDWGTFYGDIKAGRFQMYSLAWVGIKTPDIFRYVFHSDSVPPVGANRGRYRSTRADRFIESAEQSSDLAGQAENYRRLQRLLLQDLPYVPLWYEEHVFVTRSGVSGYRVAADGNYDGLTRIDEDSAVVPRKNPG
jgi:peptide/nickel transport system substrate-binding protein